MANSYIDKKDTDRHSIYDILQKVGTAEYKNGATKDYKAVGIDTIIINSNKFTNYGQYSFIWEKTFVKSPQRSSSGNLGNLNSYATFLTPHLIIDFSIMSIEDYRKIMILHYGSNEFTVECYDPIYNRKIKVKMYFGTEQMAKLYTIAQKRLLPDGQWEDWVDLVGVTNYKVELIGTNNSLDIVSVKYEYNAPKDENNLPIYPNGVPVTPQYEEDIYLGEEIVVGSNSTFPTTPPSNAYQFSHWSMLGENGEILGTRTNGLVITVNSPITFRAEWKPINTHTLSFNYGLSEADYTVENGIREEISNISVQKGQSIGVLPKLTEKPAVTYNGKLEYPYENGGWYKHPVKQSDMKVNDGDLYWLDRGTIIYALYDKKLFYVAYHTNQTDITISTQYVAYGEEVYTPVLYHPNHIFRGWYLDAGYEKIFSGTMPPRSINLYARWENL